MKRLLSILVSLILLGLIYWKVDFRGLVQVFRDSHRWWLMVSLGMVVPLTLLTAWRLKRLMPHGAELGFGEANRLILVASVLNMVLPSKMGDIAKAYFMKDRGHLGGSIALSLVLFEKTCDMLSLLLWCVFGLLLYPSKGPLFWTMAGVVALGLVFGLLLLGSRSFAQLFFGLGRRFAPRRLSPALQKLHTSWDEMLSYFWQEKAELYKVGLISVFIWSLHLLQIWFFILALKSWAPFVANLALSPLAILAGLLPFTFAGVGTRDAALIAFYQPFFNAPTAAALGVLCTSRYLLPAIGGLPFLGQYLATARGLRSFR